MKASARSSSDRSMASLTARAHSWAERRSPHSTIGGGNVHGRPGPGVHPPSARDTLASGPMCEHYVARAAEPFRLDELWPVHRAPRAFRDRRVRLGRGMAHRGRAARARTATCGHSRDDPGRGDVGPTTTTSAARPSAPAVEAVHAGRSRHAAVRRTRPAGSRSATTATCAHYRPCARRTAAQGRIHGRADTEVGPRWLEDAWQPNEPVGHLLGALHDRLRRPGEPRRAASPTARPTTTRATARTRSSRSGSAGSASSRPGIYSLDRSLFRFVAPRRDRAPARAAAHDGEPRLRDGGRATARDDRECGDAVTMSAPGGSTSRGTGMAEPRRSRRPTSGRRRRGCRSAQLIRLSLYWLGLSSIFTGLGQINVGRLEFTVLVAQGHTARPCSS